MVFFGTDLQGELNEDKESMPSWIDDVLVLPQPIKGDANYTALCQPESQGVRVRSP